MAVPFNLDHLNIKFKFDTLTVSVTQASHGIFKYACTMHQHSSSTYELHLVSGGKGTLILKDTALALNTGNLYMTGPGIAHGQQTDTNSPMEEYCIALDVKKNKKAKMSTMAKLFFETTFWFGNDYCSHCLYLFQRLEQESANQEIGYAHNAECLISELIVELIRNYTGRVQLKEHTNISLTHRRTMLIDQYFLLYYATITESRLCELLALSPRQLQRFLKKNYNKTFSQMRQSARLAKACELYKKGLPLIEIAEDVGYTDLQYLKQMLQQMLQ